MGKLVISEIILFNSLSNKWRITGGVINIFK